MFIILISFYRQSFLIILDKFSHLHFNMFTTSFYAFLESYLIVPYSSFANISAYMLTTGLLDFSFQIINSSILIFVYYGL